ncbi:SH3 domain-containing protein [Lachnospiraceae bacterium 46-15]
MRRKWLMVFCALAVMGCMVTACGGGAEKATEKASETQTESAAETETQPVTEETEPETQAESVTETAAATEKATEAAAAEPKTMYVVSDVYIRQAADASSEAVAVAHLGDEVTAVPEDDKWYKVKLGDKEGYVVKDYLTDSKEEADQAVKSEEAAKAAAEAAAQAAQPQAAPSGGGVYEVSRQAFDDCDGSGHGYYEITYSDGSVRTEEY